MRLIASFIGSVETIEHYAFYYSGEDSDTMSITFMGNVDTIEQYAFSTSGRYANFMSVDFRGNVTTIGDKAFYLSGVVSITYNGNLPSFCRDVFKYSQYEKCRMDEDPPGMKLTTGHGVYSSSSQAFIIC